MLSVQDLPSVFADLTPVPQNEEPDRVCVIEYSSSFSLAYSYLYAVLAANELSERALKLSATCLKMNPANYTVWSFRRKCLGFLDHTTDQQKIRADLELTALLGGSNPKNYQIWYHRRALLETHGARKFLDDELAYIALVLGEDAKNYHAWSYRQWLLMTVDDESAWERELEIGVSSFRCVASHCVAFAFSFRCICICISLCSVILLQAMVVVFDFQNHFFTHSFTRSLTIHLFCL